jgi:hypothetical protein
MRIPRRLRRLGLALAAAALALAGGIAYAAAKGSPAVVTACAQNVNGQLRLDTGDGCQPSEHAVQWNEAGNTDSTVRNISGFIFVGTTASSPVIAATGQFGTLSFTCDDLKYATNATDTNTFQDRFTFYSPQVPASPAQQVGDAVVHWPAGVNDRWFDVMIEGANGAQPDVSVISITGYVKYFPQFSGCSYFAFEDASNVRAPETRTP